MTRKFTAFSKVAVAAAVLSVLAPLHAEEMEEIVVVGDLGSLPGENVKSVFGFNKSLLETPRSASTVSSEQMERFNMGDIDELIVLAPGTFTQSFFGVAGGLDVRGTPGETYFRGVRRLDNPGNYPTPIGASDRVDIVRGPASPIYGPSKIGGYLNFNPKSARIEENGSFIESNTGALSYTTGNWDKSILTAEVGGPGEVFGKDLGFYLYGELENSGSYYNNSATDQTLLQGSFDVDWSDNTRLQFGGMYHRYEGNQIAGWNRLTQDLIDHGTYITGSPAPLDTSGDGSISHQEYFAGGVLTPFLFGVPNSTIGSVAELEVATGEAPGALAGMGLINPGVSKIDGSDVLVAADDELVNEVITLYFDIIHTTDNDWEFRNQLFYEAYENNNENAYGFSQFHDSYVIEDKLVISKQFQFDSMLASIQISPSIRYTDFEHGDDFINEYFDRRDLTGPSTAIDRRLLSTRIDDDYSDYNVGDYTDYGFAVMGDFTWENGLSVLLGARYDLIEMESSTPVDKQLFGGATDIKESDDFDGVSWTASVSYEFGPGLIPYITASEQSTVIAGQGADIDPGNIASGGAFDQSELQEIGLKGSLLDDTLYFAISAYKQERTDFSAQSIVTNQSTETKGGEIEVRWVVTEQLVMTFGYSNIEVTNLETVNSGGRFSFVGAQDVPNLPAGALYGGALFGFVTPTDGVRAGMPEEIFSMTGTYDFLNGWAVSGSVVDVDAVTSGVAGSVELPSYTLFNLGVVYETENWVFNVTGKNLTDEDYFRANFPNLFGGQIVLPELPRHFQARVQYRF
ncbi:MAG: TonB-dependent siderophore receptor [Pseudomonadales bacterium]|jgi:iron complex outermembrane receptor protein|tara:strand:- start:259 stop:2655 length:2397 start_codon:yes stop_codon:yes gene_type:complete